MERIKIAVEKAREQAAAQQLPAGNEALKTAESPFEKDFPTINYSKTKIVELDLEHLERHRIVAYNKNHPSNWMFDILRTRVLQRMVENGWRTLAVTSPSPEAGKTVVSINLAMSIAHQTRHTAMLVDFDLRRPKVGNYLGIETDVSLNDVLAGDADVSDVMVNPNLPRLVVVPTKRPVEKSSEMLSSKRAERIITDLRGRYDERIVIFDLPPLLAADDAIAILPKIDCVLLVVGNGMSTEREIKDSLRHLTEANLLGLVMNKAELPTKNNYY
jgi:capsular exopolysaccharide synthesis family protein